MSTIAVHVEDAVALITLDRPDKRNAINDEMRTALTAAFAAFDADPSVRVVVLTGAGSAFCAGGDLSASATPDPQRPRIVEPLDQFSKPVIAAINGLAFGGGLELALACDLRIAAIGARFALPEVRIGSLPGSGGTQRLPAVIGPSLAAQMILTGEPIDAARALAAGLVTELCEPDKLLDVAMGHARTIARNAPLAVIAAKRALRVAAGTHRAENLDVERKLFNELALSEDRNEGRQAFREKRQPVFKGKRMAWRQASIVGVGATRQGKLPDETPLSLAAQAFRLALEDCGIDKGEVDGLLTMPGTTSPEGAKNYLNVGELVGVNPRFTGSLTMGGATGGALVQIAAMAIATGMAKTVACIFADTARTGGSRFAAAAGGDDSWGVWGMFGNAANSAMGFRRHMALYGSRSEHLGWIAVTCRKHATMNPNAVMRDPITLDDHQNSRLIVDPLRLLDCCLISDGAVCVIVTSPERARDCRKRPVAIWGMGQGHTTENLRLREWWYLPHQRDCVADAYRMAGASPKDISVAQLYDNFTVAVLFWLEHAGFCAEGEGGAFVEGGARITLGGSLPINTAGGNLSESYMQGWLHIVEGVRQLRGECGERQVADAELCLVTGRGMTLNTASCLILGH